MPRVSVINGYDAGMCPQEISKLKTFSLLFIKLASNFQTHLKLGPAYSKIPENQKMVGIRGNSIQLPIPIQNTIYELESNLSNNTLLDVGKHLIIYNKGNSNKEIIFKNLVNVHDIKDAFIWLKSHNNHYAHILIPSNPNELLPVENVAIINEHNDIIDEIIKDTVSKVGLFAETKDMYGSECDEMVTQDVYCDSECDEMVTQDVCCDSECDEMVTLDVYCDSECDKLVTQDVHSRQYCDGDNQFDVYCDSSYIGTSNGTLITQDDYLASGDNMLQNNNNYINSVKCDEASQDIKFRNENNTLKPRIFSKEFDVTKHSDTKLIGKLSDFELNHLIEQYIVTAVNTVSDNPDPATFDTLYNLLKIKVN